MKRKVLGTTLVSLGLILLVAALKAPSTPPQRGRSAALFHPVVAEWQFLSSSPVPPSEAACNSVGRRCFTPQAMQNSYNLASLLAAGNQGQGKTIAVIDSFGSATIANDLNVFQHRIWSAASLRRSGSDLHARYANVHHPGAPGIASAQSATA